MKENNDYIKKCFNQSCTFNRDRTSDFCKLLLSGEKCENFIGFSDFHKKKPPLGVKSEFIFKEERIYALADGIDRFIKAGLLEKDCNLIYEWCTELHHRLLTYREDLCERNKN